MPNFATPQPITAVVEIAAGSIRLVASDRDDTVAEVRPRDESRPHDVKAAEQARIDFRNGTLSSDEQSRVCVSAQGSGDRRYRTAGRVAASMCRSHRRMSARTGGTPIASWRRRVATSRWNRWQEASRPTTASGAVTAGAVKGAAVIDTASGNATIGDLDGDVKFRAASGR